MTSDGYPREATPEERADWDRLTVLAPGGHVYQSTTWAAERAKLGWRPLQVMLDADDHAALVLIRPFPWVGGASAYIPRGPIVDAGRTGEAGDAGARRVARLADWLADKGVAVVATDAEVPAADRAYGAGLVAAGFHPIPEIQPSRHRVSVALAPDTDDAAVRAGLAKSTRQRVSAAESDVVVQRHDTAGWTGFDPLFVRPTVDLAAALGGFATLLEGTGQRLGFRFGPRQVFLDWWTAAHAAGSAGAPVLGSGLDTAPDHREPGEGDPMAGLYEHKRSFGASWVEMTGAHERVLRPARYAVGRAAARLARLVQR